MLPAIRSRAVWALCLVLAIGGSNCPARSRSEQRTTASPAAPRVDINRARLEELLKIPGMKSTWAGRIVRFRPYRTKQDLLDRGVLPGDVYRRVKDSLIAHREKP